MNLKIVALAGGVGGAKLADGLAQVMEPGYLTVIVNTGDDFDYLGLHICPDLDTVCYTLAGKDNLQTGWGQRNETWNVHTRLSALGAPNWFRLGDLDLATHLFRTQLLKQGDSLSDVTKQICKQWEIPCKVLPMTDQKVQTRIETDNGEWLDFQEYFVHQHWQPIVKNIRFDGANQDQARNGCFGSHK